MEDSGFHFELQICWEKSTSHFHNTEIRRTKLVLISPCTIILFNTHHKIAYIHPPTHTQSQPRMIMARKDADTVACFEEKGIGFQLQIKSKITKGAIWTSHANHVM